MKSRKVFFSFNFGLKNKKNFGMARILGNTYKITIDVYYSGNHNVRYSSHCQITVICLESCCVFQLSSMCLMGGKLIVTLKKSGPSKLNCVGSCSNWQIPAKTSVNTDKRSTATRRWGRPPDNLSNLNRKLNNNIMCEYG